MLPSPETHSWCYSYNPREIFANTISKLVKNNKSDWTQLIFVKSISTSSKVPFTQRNFEIDVKAKTLKEESHRKVNSDLS